MSSNTRIELELEHHYKNKFLGKHALKPGKHVTVLGSGLAADIRLLGQDVGEVHAYVEYSDGQWYIIDAGSGQGTWVAKQPIMREAIHDEATVSIGGHQLKFKRRSCDVSMFQAPKIEGAGTTAGTQLFHQVIIKKRGVVHKTALLASVDTFYYEIANDNHHFRAPKEGEVLEKKVGDYQILQRLVRTSVAEGKSGKEMMMSNARGPTAIALGVIMMLVLIIAAMPSKPQQDLAAPSLDQNKFTRMIVDSKMMKKKRQEARERQKKMGEQPAGAVAQQQPQKSMTTPIQSKGATPKVVSQLKTAGLSALLGKISKRASSVGVKIESNGVAAETGVSRSVAVATVGSLQGIGTQAGNGGTTFKVGGVGTLGKGGGSGSVAGMGGLAVGAAGTGSVGIIDEETEIEGGLDKDVIAKVIASNLGEIRYCYERQLSADPDLYGKVMLKFSIDAAGAVSTQKIGTTTLKSAMVEGCILRRVANWKFPKPRGGTTVLVTYPFLFKSTN